MPIPILRQIFTDGLDSVPFLSTFVKLSPWLLVIFILKYWFNGMRDSSERVLHSKVAIVTGGASGIGAAVVHELASRGTQLILLVRDPASIFTIDYINSLRERYNNQLIYAEKCDLADLHSVRLFATKFIDNSPPRRLDMVVCCAGVMAPPGIARSTTMDGVETHWGVNYLGHFHLLTLLEPLLKVQPADRDVRVLLATCQSYILGELDLNDVQFLKRKYPLHAPWKCYGASKLALMAFGVELQRRLWECKRPDEESMNVRVFNVDPGFARTPGMRRWLSLGSLWGLFAYLLTWPFWWLVLKDPSAAAQPFMTVAMSFECTREKGGDLIRECKKVEYRKENLTSPELGKQLWELSTLMIADLEKASAKKRVAEKAKVKAVVEDEKTAKGGGRSTEDGKVKVEEISDPADLDSSLKEKLQKHLSAQKEKRRALDALIKEEEKAAGGCFDLPELLPDKKILRAKSRSRSRSRREQLRKKNAKARDQQGGKAMPDAPAKNTRSRSRARHSVTSTPVPQVKFEGKNEDIIEDVIRVQFPQKRSVS